MRPASPRAGASSSGVSTATSRPCFRMTTREQSDAASDRMCVESSTVRPAKPAQRARAARPSAPGRARPSARRARAPRDRRGAPARGRRAGGSPSRAFPSADPPPPRGRTARSTSSTAARRAAPLSPFTPATKLQIPPHRQLRVERHLLRAGSRCWRRGRDRALRHVDAADHAHASRRSARRSRSGSRMSVLFPDPFGPSSATISPRSTSNDDVVHGAAARRSTS